MIKVACVGIIENLDGAILITKRAVSPFYNQYVMPGGKLDQGESVYECVAREVEEEVGLKVIDSEFFDIFEVFFFDTQYLIMFFKTEVEGFNLKINRDEIKSYSWVTVENYLNFNLTEGTKFILEKFFGKIPKNVKGRKYFE